MKIKKVILENFRCYKERTIIDIDDLTVFIGKNDAGKSTILDALEIFFYDGKGKVKIEKEDLNKEAERERNKDILIGVVFSALPSELIIDSTVPITLEDEYLLNENGDLEIHKIFRDGKLKGTFIFAKHPANDDFIKDLLLKPISELRDFVNQRKLKCEDKRKASLLRKSIRDSYGELTFENILIPVDKDGMREIWSKISRYLPVYTLFKSDRANTEGDPEIQDPLKVTVREIIQRPDVQEKLSEIAEEIKNAVMEIASATLDELKRINPEVAQELRPDIPDVGKLKWENVFKEIGIVSDDGIPLDKRGSGVRRLVLLSFFSAEVKRRKENNAVNVVYAIEEPETSQHPDHQKLLINNFIELSKTGNSQVILTTHSPSIAQLLPIDSLRLVKKEDNRAIVQSGKDNDNILLGIVESLGILPTLNKVVVCVEGERDRLFLLDINEYIPELKEIVDLSSKLISIIPMSGSNLRNWIDRYYLENSSVIEFHLYDRDCDEKYKEAIDKVNSRPDPSFGTLTQKREIENYIHKSLIEKEFNITIDNEIDWDNENIPVYINRITGKKVEIVKDILCGKLSKKMTKEMLEELGTWEEVKGWFEKIKESVSISVPVGAEQNVPQA